MTQTVLEQLKNYQHTKLFGFSVRDVTIEYSERRHNETHSLIKAVEEVRHSNGTYERMVVEYTPIKEVA